MKQNEMLQIAGCPGPAADQEAGYFCTRRPEPEIWNLAADLAVENVILELMPYFLKTREEKRNSSETAGRISSKAWNCRH